MRHEPSLLPVEACSRFCNQSLCAPMAGAPGRQHEPGRRVYQSTAHQRASECEMFIFEEDRGSDSPFVETIWRTQSESAGTFPSRAVSHWEIVVMQQNGRTGITVRGPETKATTAHCPPNAEFVGITFKLGACMPLLPTVDRLDGEGILPEATSKSFWLNGSAWQFPDYDNADTILQTLALRSAHSQVNRRCCLTRATERSG